MSKKQVLVIIVTYNAMKWVDKCVASLYISSIPVDIFVVDNNSSDGSGKYLKETYPDIKLVESKTNLGFGGANNIGLKYALDNVYEYVYLLNQDAWIFEDTIHEMVKISETYVNFGVLSPMHLNSSCTKFDRNFMYCCPREMLSDYFCKNVSPVYETNFVMAAHWFISRSCLQSIGGFSPSFSHYGEDHNYLHRVLFAGYKIGVVPTALSVHDREYRVESKQSNLHKIYIQGIVDISNINKNLLSQMLLQPLILLKFAVSNKSFILIFKIFKLIKKYPLYVFNRKKSKERAFI